MVNTLVVGYGYWGQVLTSNLLWHPDFFVAGVHDPDADARRLARSRNLYAFAGLEDAINHTAPQAVVIASPINTIVDTAVMALNRHAHVLMAKPGPVTIADAERIASLAMRRGRTAMVDYTMAMSSSLPRHVERARTFGDLNTITCIRDAIGVRTTASVLDDLAVHDLSLVCAAFPDMRWHVHFVERATNRCHIVLRSGDVQASIYCRRDATTQRRVMRFAMDRGVVEWNQLVGDDDAGPVVNRLNLFRDRIKSEPAVDDMMFKVTELLEAAR